METTLTIKFTDKGMSYQLSKAAQVDNLIQVAMTFVQMLADDMLTRVPEDSKLDAQKEVFDMINNAASNVLHNIDPTIELHPNLTEVAILLAENTLLKQAEARGLTVEEFLPEAKLIQEREFELFKRNEAGQRRHLQKLRKEKENGNLTENIIKLPRKH